MQFTIAGATRLLHIVLFFVVIVSLTYSFRFVLFFTFFPFVTATFYYS